MLIVVIVLLMEKKIISRCPICSGPLVITSMHCNTCGTDINGEFEMLEFYALNDSQLEFIRCFLKNRGSITEVEKELDISYPTVRAKLDDALSALAIATEERRQIDKPLILQKFKKGKLTLDEAVDALNGKISIEGD